MGVSGEVNEQSGDETAVESPEDSGAERGQVLAALRSLDSSLTRRLGAVVTAAAVAVGGLLVVADPEDGGRIVTDAGPDAEALSMLDLTGESGLRLQASDGTPLGTLTIPRSAEADDAESTTSAADDGGESTTTTAAVEESSTTNPSAAANQDDESTTTTDSSTTTTERRTTTTRPTTSTTRRTTTTTRPTTTTTRPTTTTTRPTTTTTRPTTTTTRPTTTTTRPTTTTTQSGGSCSSGAEFELVMRDDFNGSSVAGHWNVWDSGGNGPYGPRRARNLWVSNGQLTLKAAVENGTLYTAGMQTHHRQTYGKYRFRVRTDVDPDRVMSGVILTWPSSNDHLRDGENNIYETLPHQDSPTRDPFYSFIHKPFASNPGQQEYKIWQADANGWQTMTMEWTPDRITISRQGGETWTVNETGSNLIPDANHAFHIQFDATKHWMGSTLYMNVDWAEVYRYCG